jgi:hypothetical protein
VAWATALMAARFRAATMDARMSARVRLDMGASDRSTDLGGAGDWLVGGDAGPASQLPPATGQPCPAPPAAGWAGGQPRLGGLLLELGAVLVGQGLAEVGVLVVHVVWLPWVLAWVCW